jgi:type IV secretion system protein VirB6
MSKFNLISMQQGGLGLLLTALIVSVPPMAATFFQGTLGNLLRYSAFGGASNSVGPSGQPPGSWSASRSRAGTINSVGKGDRIRVVKFSHSEPPQGPLLSRLVTR